MEAKRFFDYDEFLRSLMEHLAQEIEPKLRATAMAQKLGICSTVKAKKKTLRIGASNHPSA